MLTPNTERLYAKLHQGLRAEGFSLSLRALEFVRERHTGFRKDGVTPELEHLLIVALFLFNLREMLLAPDQTVSTGLLHDSIEDGRATHLEVVKVAGPRVAESVLALDKRNVETAAYYSRVARDIKASLVKPVDRIHNFHSMTGVFTAEKQRDYILEGRTHVLPMIKEAKTLHPGCAPVYNTMKHILLLQIDLVEAFTEHRQFALPSMVSR